MEIIKYLIDFILHLDVHLADIIRDYGVWAYAILFLIIFVETGLVIMPFLPGDSLLFVAGAFAVSANSDPAPFNIFYLIGLLFIAAFLGDTLNYAIGNYFGPKVFQKNYRFLKREHLEKTEAFYHKHGGKTIIFARFIPIIRTFAPFIAGVGSMRYGKFLVYNLIGGFLWVAGFLMAGYFFGNIPIVKKYFTFVIFGIIGISVLPAVIEVLKHKFSRQEVNA